MIVCFWDFISYEYKRHRRSCVLGLGEERADESPDSVIPSLRCLCPKLEVFDIDDAIFPKHVLFEFLRSRLVDYDQPNLVRLRSVYHIFRPYIGRPGLLRRILTDWLKNRG
jgi:hypothetical protein